MSTKYNSDCLNKAWDDEPVFVILGRDPEGPATIVSWVAHSLNQQPFTKLHDALKVAEEMTRFHAANFYQLEERKGSEKKSIPMVKHAMNVIIGAMNADPDYRRGWSSNIAMAFVDAWVAKYGKVSMVDCVTEDISWVGNIAADNFLNTLTKIPTPEGQQQQDQPLNPTEAIYGFVAWLTTRPQPTVFSSLHDSALAVPLIQEFVKANSLPKCRENYAEFLIPVKEEAETKTVNIFGAGEVATVDDNIFDEFDKWNSDYAFIGGQWVNKYSGGNVASKDLFRRFLKERKK